MIRSVTTVAKKRIKSCCGNSSAGFYFQNGHPNVVGRRGIRFFSTNDNNVQLMLALDHAKYCEEDKDYTDDYVNKLTPATTRPPSTTKGRFVGFKTTDSGSGGPGSGGGDGGGRYRCPKCNTFVTFRPSSDFEVNTFYCSTCALWYMAGGNSLYQVKRNDTKTIANLENSTQSLDAAKQSEHLLTFVHSPETAHQKYPLTNEKISSAKPEENHEMEPSDYDDKQSAATSIPAPLEICKGLNEYVIGQSLVKMALSVGVHNHYKRLTVAEAQAEAKNRQQEASNASEATTDPFLGDNAAGGLSDLNNYGSRFASDKTFCETPDAQSIMNQNHVRTVGDCEIDKSNLLLLGPTGSGKTLLVKTLAKIIDVPLVIADATCLTQAGYVGEDVESILFKLYLESGQDLERCQRGIIYLDETDKIRKSGGNVSISRDVSGEGVQHALLKIVEGNVINVPKEPGRKNPRGDFLQIDTSNILFICGGAFAGLERIINKRLDASSIGFGAQMKKDLENHMVTSHYFDAAIPKDLVDYGMIPEFVGRFPVIVSTRGLNIKNLVDILTVPKNSLIKQYEYLFAINDVNLHVTQCALEEIAKTAHKRGSGARGLRSITENVLMETMFVVPSLPDVHTVYIDAPAVRRERKPVLLKANMTVERYEMMKKDAAMGEEVFDEGIELVNLDDANLDGDFLREIAA